MWRVKKISSVIQQSVRACLCSSITRLSVGRTNAAPRKHTWNQKMFYSIYHKCSRGSVFKGRISVFQYFSTIWQLISYGAIQSLQLFSLFTLLYFPFSQNSLILRAGEGAGMQSCWQLLTGTTLSPAALFSSLWAQSHYLHHHFMS